MHPSPMTEGYKPVNTARESELSEVHNIFNTIVHIQVNGIILAVVYPAVVMYGLCFLVLQSDHLIIVIV